MGIWGFLGPSGGLGDPRGTPGRPEKGLETPPGARETCPGQGFYINPSRRGPAVSGAGPGGSDATQ